MAYNEEDINKLQQKKEAAEQSYMQTEREKLQNWIEEAEAVLMEQLVSLQEVKRKVKWMGHDEADVVMRLLNLAIRR
jgi:hypothetical protein